MTEDPRAAAALETLFADWRGDAPGGVAAILRDGRVVAQRAFGLASLEHGVVNGAETRFHIASVTKTFVGALLQMLAREGRLDLDEDVRRWIPELRLAGITLRRLAGMTAGLRDAMEMMRLRGVWWRYPRSGEDLLALALAQDRPSFPSGARYAYTNIQFNLCAEVIARATGQGFEAALREMILAPLGMTATVLRDDNETVTPGLAAPYIREGEAWRHGAWSFGLSGAGGLVSSLSDLIRWNLALREDAALLGAMAERGRLLDGTAVNYGTGLAVRRWRGLTVLNHGGSLPGYKASFARIPERDLGFVLLSNREDADPYARLRRFVDLMADPPEPPPAPMAPLGIEGRFVDRESGELLTLTQTPDHLAAEKLGTKLELRPRADGTLFHGWANFDSLLRVAPGPLLHLDMGGQRGVYEPAAPPAAPPAIAGRYLSDALATEHVVTPDGRLHMGPPYHAEAALALEWVAPFALLARGGRPGWETQYALRFAEDLGSYRISSDRLKDVVFTRA
jgi:CubicO group peptidase (beta-lactamase class C family)